MLTVIIPNLNQADALSALTAQLCQREAKTDVKIILSDGGSKDASLDVALRAGARIVSGCCGRGHQLRRAVRLAETEWLLFLHADSELDEAWLSQVKKFIQGHPKKAGYFDMRFKATGFAPRFCEFAVGLRSFFLGLPYGDQGLLISRAHYEEVGGYLPLPLFEDVDLIRKIGRGRLKAVKSPLWTDASKYERDGYFRRGWRNIKLARRYYKGADPVDLSRIYNEEMRS